MTNLLSGKEALIALANGEEVELQALGDVNWYNSTQWTVGELLCFRGRFRIKPRTILINGIEVPCCGENYQYGDAMYILNSLDPKEYSLVVLDFVDGVPAYWWKTESEIKQVVEALRTIFKTD